MMIFGTTLMVPSGDPQAPQVAIDLTAVAEAEARLHDLKIVNRQTAPELMAAYNAGYLEATRAMATLHFEHSMALRQANKRKAVVMLEVAPQKLQELGLVTARNPAGSEDMRTAVLEQDEEYLQLLDKVDFIKAAYELVKGKAKALENAYNAVKKVIDPNNNNLGNPLLDGASLPDEVEAGQTVHGFGRARYGKGR